MKKTSLHSMRYYLNKSHTKNFITRKVLKIVKFKCIKF